jgi:hypothetical protein
MSALVVRPLCPAAWLAAIAFLLSGGVIHAAENEVAREPAVRLPPMVVSESSKAPRWWYVSVPGAEYLSRCSESATRDFVEAELHMQQLLRVLVPAEFLPQTDVPTITVLSSADLKQESDALVKDMVQRTGESSDRRQRESRHRVAAALGTVEVLPNLRLQDADSKALFVSLDEHTFEPDHLVLVPEYVRTMLEQRTPMLPPWLIAGFTDVYTQAMFVTDPVTLKTPTWLTRRDTRALAANPEWPRALLPPEDLFGPAVPRDQGTASSRGAVWRSEAALFVRWALDPKNGVRDPFWKFVERSDEAPASERMFEECFGFGYAALFDRLSDYLPVAVKDPIRIEPGKLPKPPKIDVRPATPDEVARLQGEWERLEIAYVKPRFPQFLTEYTQRALRTLHRAYDRGARDLRLSAAIGLGEVDAGNDTAALPFLEQAAAGGVKRPRVYAELARLHYAEWVRRSGTKMAKTAAELAPVLEPLRIGVQQNPALADTYGMLVTCWLRCSERPPASDLALLDRGARLFRWYPDLTFRIAILNANSGHRDRAAALLEESVGFVPDDANRARFEQLLTAVTAKK